VRPRKKPAIIPTQTLPKTYGAMYESNSITLDR
jgi:hypothetical protein